MSDTEAPDIVERRSTHTFDETLERLLQAITAAGMTIFAKIDHAANAKEAGQTMRPTTILIYGAPKGGTSVMVTTPLAALDLPLRVLVRTDEEGRVFVAYHPIRETLRRIHAPEDAAARLEPAQQMLLTAIAS